MDRLVDRIFGSEFTKRLQWADSRIVASNETGTVECGSQARTKVGVGGFKLRIGSASCIL